MPGSAAITTCPAGFYCSSTTSLPVKCARGTYSGAGAVACTTCPTGYACLDGVLTACSAGRYQTSTSMDYCVTCPYGYYCGSTAAYACSLGSSYGAGGATSCTVLSSTQYSPAITAPARTCPSGYYQSSSGTTCVLCPAGYYCSGTNAASLCDASYYYISTIGMSGCLTFSSTMATSYSTHTISDTAFCSGGQYRYSYIQCAICSAGYYCPNPVTSGYSICGAGTYSSQNGMMFCYVCPPASFCTGYSSVGTIPAGYYTNDATTYYACPVGSWCPTTNLVISCPSGYYSGGYSTACSAATPGYYSVGSTQYECGYAYSFPASTTCITAPYGFSVGSQDQPYSSLNYCGNGNYGPLSTYCRNCYYGYYCPTAASQIGCPAGFYCPTASTWPIMCKTGGYCPGGTDYVYGCDGNYYTMYRASGCIARTFVDGYYQYAQTTYIKAVAPGAYLYGWGETGCGVDTYCIYGTQTACPTGLETYQMASTNGNFYCIDCPYGKACYASVARNCYNISRFSESGNTDCFQCEKDQDCVYRNQYFWFRNSVDDQLVCPKTHYANVGDLTCSEIKRLNNHCPLGYYENITAGNATLHTAEKMILCLEYGYFGGTNRAVDPSIVECETGTYTTNSFNSCVASEPGYLNAANNTDVYISTDLCPQGFYCGIDYEYLSNTESLSTQRCPYSSLARNPFVGGKSESETCQLCPPGKYCKGDSIVRDCPTSYLCELGTIWPTTTCPAGFYYDTHSTSENLYERCVQCPENYYCPNKSTDATMQPCPTGYQCGVGSVSGNLYSSEVGTVITTSGGSASSCALGYYCPEGASIQSPCPVCCESA